MAGADITGNSVSADEAYQLPQVWLVFGGPVTLGDKTFIPVARFVYVRGLGRLAHLFARHEIPSGVKLKLLQSPSISSGNGSVWLTTPVAVVEISRGKVRIHRIVNPLPMALAGMLLGGWNAYWVLKTIREWRARR